MSTTLSNALAGGTCCLSKAGVAAGTTTTTTIALTNYAIGGRMFSKAAAANGATPTVDAATGAAFVPLTAGKSCIFVYALDAAGALKAVQGPHGSNRISVCAGWLDAGRHVDVRCEQHGGRDGNDLHVCRPVCHPCAAVGSLSLLV